MKGMKNSIINSINSIVKDASNCIPVILKFRHSFALFDLLFKPLILLTGFIYVEDSYKGVMCPVLHMARCTNVATFEILPLHSEVVRGW